jgi:peptide/nickel transport system ATP-binding protein
MTVTGEANVPVPPATTDCVLEVDGLEVQFATDRGWQTVIEDVSFGVPRGRTVGIVGESGSGKSVTSLAVMGLIPTPPGRVTGGRIVLEGNELVGMKQSALSRLRGNRIAMIFQEPMTSLNPAFTVGDQISETVRRHRKVSRKAGRARAIEVLDLVGIPNARRRVTSYPHEFSGGMRQRVMIAMALACEPSLLIADEPTTALDVTIQAQILDLLRSMQDQLGMAMLFITHDLGVVADICDSVLVMYAGQIVERAEIDELYASPQHPYTEGLLSSMPQVGTAGEPLQSIPGGPPPLWDMPEHCRFAPRCPYRAAECVSGPVPLIELQGDRAARCIRVDEIELRGTA